MHLLLNKTVLIHVQMKQIYGLYSYATNNRSRSSAFVCPPISLEINNIL